MYVLLHTSWEKAYHLHVMHLFAGKRNFIGTDASVLTVCKARPMSFIGKDINKRSCLAAHDKQVKSKNSSGEHF